jgi:hypothetical protein
VVVFAGDTDTEVPVTVPTPLLIERVTGEVPVIDQLRVVDPPGAIVGLVAVKLEMVGAVGLPPPPPGMVV